MTVVIPSKRGEYLEYTLKSLANQTIKPDEVVLVLKNCKISKIEKICDELGLNCIIEEQKRGYFTHALNMGKNFASGDIILFTDDDAIATNIWVEQYIKQFLKYPERIGGISSRDVYYDISTRKIIKTPDDYFHIKLYRLLVRPLFDPPHPELKKYRFGSYISKKYKFVYGSGIPNKVCYSLPFRGVNMAFRKEAIEDIYFIEHEGLKAGFRNEQHFGVQLILKGYDSIYVPDNFVYHIIRTSLSRFNGTVKKQLMKEEEIVRRKIIQLLEEKR